MIGGDDLDGRAWFRYIDIGGNLGFHAPFLKGIPTGAYSKETVEEAFTLGIKTIRDLTQLGQKHHVPDSVFPRIVLAEMLDKGPNEVFLVDTIYKAAQLRIDVFGAKVPALSLAGLVNACLNRDLRAEEGFPLSSPPPAESHPYRHRKSQIWIDGFGHEGLGSCVVRTHGPSDMRYEMTNRLVASGRTGLVEDEDLISGKTWWTLPPVTKIGSLR